MKINKYPDGTSYVNGIGIGVEGSTFRVNSYEDLWHLNQAVDAYNSMFGNHIPTITIPNLIDAQADRRFNKGDSSGLKLVCDFLSRMKANFRIFHPHNPEVVEALIDRVEIIDNSEFVLEVFEKIDISLSSYNYSKEKLDNTMLMSPDAGSYKSLMKLCDKIRHGGEVYPASKSRSWDWKNRKSTLSQVVDRTDFNGKDIIIVDDLCVYGGTFKGLSKLLRERNCGKLYLAVSHMTIQSLGEDPVTNYFDKVFTTNSKFNNYFTPSVSNGVQPKNLEIIKLF